MADDNIAVTGLGPDVAVAYATIREAREQALRLQQRLRGVAAFIGRARPSSRHDEPKTVQKRRGAWLVRIAATLIIAAPLSACGTAAIGPVDHECHANPARSQGSGCGNA